MMNISPILNSVKCTVLACFAQFWHVLEGSTNLGTRLFRVALQSTAYILAQPLLLLLLFFIYLLRNTCSFQGSNRNRWRYKFNFLVLFLVFVFDTHVNRDKEEGNNRNR